ncbi:uncharacterized protein LOC144123731 [Amblyomma americanum]
MTLYHLSNALSLSPCFSAYVRPSILIKTPWVVQQRFAFTSTLEHMDPCASALTASPPLSAASLMNSAQGDRSQRGSRQEAYSSPPYSAVGHGQPPPADSPVSSGAGSSEEVEAHTPALSAASAQVEANGGKTVSPSVRSNGIMRLFRKAGELKSGTTSNSLTNAPAKSSPPPDAAVASSKQAASEGKALGHVSAAASPTMRRSSLKKASTAAASTVGTQKQHAKNVDVRSPSLEAVPKTAATSSVEASDDVHTEITRRKSSVRFGGTSIREFSHLTASLSEHHKQVMAVCIVAFLCSLLSAGGALLFFALRQVPAPYLDACSSLSCKRAMWDLDRLIDASIDPCHDFYGHVCRRWIRRTDAGYLEAAARNLLRDLNSSLNEVNEPHRVSSRFFSLAQFYQLCHRFLVARGLQLSDMLRYFSRYHDLLALSTFPEVIRRLVDLSLLRGVHTLLDIRLVRVSHAVVRLRFGRGRSLAQKCCDNSTNQLLLYLKSLLSATTAMLAEKHGSRRPSLNATDIVLKDRHIHPLLIAQNDERHYNISILKSLSKGVSSEQWLEALNAALPPKSRVENSSRILVDNADSISQVLNYFGSHSDRGVSYIYVQVLMEAMRFDYLRRHSPQGPEGAVKTCLRATWSALSGSRDLMVSAFLGAHGSAARAVFRRVLSSVLLDVERSAWMSDLIRQNAKVEVGSVSLRIFPPTALNTSSDKEGPKIASSSALSLFPGLFMDLREARQKGVLVDPPLEW